MKSPQRGAASPQQQLEETVTEDIRKAVKYPNEKVDPYLINQIITAAKAYALAIVGDDEVDDTNRVDSGTDCWACYEEDYCIHEKRDQLRAQLRREIEGK